MSTDSVRPEDAGHLLRRAQDERPAYRRAQDERHHFCPTCNSRLFNRSCKWWCPTCGYHESCADG